MYFKNISRVIKVSRRAKPGLSQGKLATALGYKDAQFISNVERGVCGLPIKKLIRAAELLSIDTIVITDAMIADYTSRFSEIR